MDRLWAPWRIGYVSATGKKKPGCLFCAAARDPRKHHVFLKNKRSFAMLNLYPYNNGHCMVVPHRHTADLERLCDDELLDLMRTLRQTEKLLKNTLAPHGFNIGINLRRVAGAGIPGHLHLHVVPRWNGDTNFMPAVCGTKVISQSLQELFLKLCRAAKDVTR